MSTCPHNHHVSCNDCRLGGICLPVALKGEDIVKLDEIVKRGKVLQKGEHVYRANQPFESVYAIRSGYIKTYQLSDEGEEQVTGFYFPGEVFGMEGISQKFYSGSAKALESTAVCEIPFAAFQDLSMKLPELQNHFFQLMSQEISEDQQLMTLLSKKNAQERVASFLLMVSARNATRKMSATSFRLPFSRTEIGNYLGLTVETVSRTIGQLGKSGVLAIAHKDVEILDVPRLQEIAKIKL